MQPRRSPLDLKDTRGCVQFRGQLTALALGDFIPSVPRRAALSCAAPPLTKATSGTMMEGSAIAGPMAGHDAVRARRTQEGQYIV